MSNKTKLYDVPRNSRIKVCDLLELNFYRVDGMYSYCTDDKGNVYHIPATEEVEVIEQKQ